MKKLYIAISLIGFMLAGCGEDLKQKPFHEFTTDNKNTLCQSKEIRNQLQTEFIKVMFGDSIPDDKKEDVKNAVSFEWKNIKADLSNNKPKRISCNAELTLTTDFDYGKSYYYQEMPFFITKDNNNDFDITFEKSRVSIVNIYKEIDITPTKGQIKFKNERDQAIKLKEQKEQEEKQKEEELKDQRLKEQQARIDSLKAIPDSEFTVITFADLQYIYFAQANIEFSDDEILSAFYPGWRNITDAFEKRDIVDKKLPEIKTKIAKYKDVKNVIALGIYQGRYEKLRK